VHVRVRHDARSVCVYGLHVPDPWGQHQTDPHDGAGGGQAL